MGDRVGQGAIISNIHTQYTSTSICNASFRLWFAIYQAWTSKQVSLSEVYDQVLHTPPNRTIYLVFKYSSFWGNTA